MNTKKLLRPVISSIILLLLVTSIGVIATSYFTSRSRNLAQKTFTSLAHLTTANQSRGQAFMYLILCLNSKDETEFSRNKERVGLFSTKSQDELNQYSSTIDTDENRLLFERLMMDRDSYITKRNAILEGDKTGATETAKQMMINELLPIYERYMENSMKLVEYVREEGEQRIIKIGTISKWTRFSAIASSVLIFLFGFFFGYTR